MTKDAVFQVRLASAKLAEWRRCAQTRGITLSRLIERAVDEDLALERALARQAEREGRS